MEFDKKDRLIIINQLKILEKLYPEEAQDLATNRKALEQGYEAHFDWMLESIYDIFPKEDSREILNILDMFRAITYSFDRLSPDDKSRISLPKFDGFDGNNETEHMMYTRYFILDLDRYPELKYGKKYCDFNSHTQKLDSYRLMLTKWETAKDKWDLSLEEIATISNQEV